MKPAALRLIPDPRQIEAQKTQKWLPATLNRIFTKKAADDRVACERRVSEAEAAIESLDQEQHERGKEATRLSGAIEEAKASLEDTTAAAHSAYEAAPKESFNPVFTLFSPCFHPVFTLF